MFTRSNTLKMINNKRVCIQIVLYKKVQNGDEYNYRSV